MSSQEKIVLVEYTSDGHPHRVDVSDGKHMTSYDFDYCKRDQMCYYDESSGGPDDKTVYVERALLEEGEAPRRLYINPEYLTNLEMLSHWGSGGGSGWELSTEEPANPFRSASASDTVYCLTCHDVIPVGDLCDHIWWCQTLGWWRGAVDEPGQEEPCEGEDCRECRERQPHKENT